MNVEQMEKAAQEQAAERASKGIRMGGLCEQIVSGVKWDVRTGAMGMIWCRNDKRVARKLAVEQMK